MDAHSERRCPVDTDGDVHAASKAALLIARRAGLSVMRQYCLAALVTELGQGVLKCSGRAVLILRDESDEGAALIRVLLRSRGPGDGASLPDARVLEAWTSRWPGQLVLEPSRDGRVLSLALRQPKPAPAR